MKQHASLASGRWHKLTIYEQLGNIGSEVGRALKSKEPKQRFEAARRALELFDLTLDDRRWFGSRGREIARSREVFCDAVFGDGQYKTDPKSLERYFMQFALAARMNR